jgi:hypothetical protein
LEQYNNSSGFSTQCWWALENFVEGAPVKQQQRTHNCFVVIGKKQTKQKQTNFSASSCISIFFFHTNGLKQKDNGTIPGIRILGKVPSFARKVQRKQEQENKNKEIEWKSLWNIGNAVISSSGIFQNIMTILWRNMHRDHQKIDKWNTGIQHAKHLSDNATGTCISHQVVTYRRLIEILSSNLYEFVELQEKLQQKSFIMNKRRKSWIKISPIPRQFLQQKKNLNDLNNC